MPDPPFLKDRILEAILRRIEGAKDLKKRLDYLMNPETLSSSARLSETQLQAIAECAWLGDTFPSLKGLAEFTQGYAKWSISREGKGREEAVAVMVSENKEIQSTLLLPGLTQQQQGKKDKKGDKEK